MNNTCMTHSPAGKKGEVSGAGRRNSTTTRCLHRHLGFGNDLGLGKKKGKKNNARAKGNYALMVYVGCLGRKNDGRETNERAWDFVSWQ